MKKDPSFDWNDFYPAERKAATVNGKVVGIPALVDNLALVYNKKMFDQAGLAYPTANWTWEDFGNAAQKLTDPGKKQFGWAYVNDGSEDTVWRFLALLWQAGGDILTPDGKKAAFDSPAGLKALSLLAGAGRRSTRSTSTTATTTTSACSTPATSACCTRARGTSARSPRAAHYGVQILPGDQNHQTISGPDNWVMFDNGDAAQAGRMGVHQLADLADRRPRSGRTTTGDLPLRQSETKLPGYKQFLAKYPGVGRVRRQPEQRQPGAAVTTVYPKISTVLGQMVQAVLLGKAQPPPALAPGRASRWTASSRCRATRVSRFRRALGSEHWPAGPSSRPPSS